MQDPHYGKPARLYQQWARMRSRCNNPNCKEYPAYGGRGIKCCDRWASYTNFLEDMGVPAKGYFVAQIDPDKDFSPENCHYVNRSLFSRRKAKVKTYVMYEGKSTPLAELARKFGLTRQSLYARIFICKMPIERALIKEDARYNTSSLFSRGKK